jgi:hypothetical protein
MQGDPHHDFAKGTEAYDTGSEGEFPEEKFKKHYDRIGDH